MVNTVPIFYGLEQAKRDHGEFGVSSGKRGGPAGSDWREGAEAVQLSRAGRGRL